MAVLPRALTVGTLLVSTWLVGCDESAPSPRAEPQPVGAASSSRAASSSSAAGSPSTTPARHAPSSHASGAASGSAAPSATAAPSADASAASSSQPEGPQKPTCAEGSYQHDDPAFCILVPEGYNPSTTKIGDVVAGVTFRSSAKGTMDMQVTWAKQPRSVYVEERKKRKADAEADPKAHVAKTRDGRGLYVRFEQELGGQPVVQGESVVYKNKLLFHCKAQAFKKPAPPRGFLTACQTLLAQ